KESVETSTGSRVGSTPSAKGTSVTSAREEVAAEGDRGTPIIVPPPTRSTQPQASAATTPSAVASRTVNEPEWAVTRAPVPSMLLNPRGSSAERETPETLPKPGVVVATPAAKPTPVTPVREQALAEVDQTKPDKGSSTPSRLHAAEILPQSIAPPAKPAQPETPTATAPAPLSIQTAERPSASSTPPSSAQEKQVAAAPPIATPPSGAAASQEAGALHGVEGPAPQAASPFGRGGRLMVLLDSPRSKTTYEATVSVSGRIQGRAASGVLLRINDSVQEVLIDRRNFKASVPLVPGENRIQAVVVGTDGVEAEDSITIEYVPKVAAPNPLTLSLDRLVLGPDDPPAVGGRCRVHDQRPPP